MASPLTFIGSKCGYKIAWTPCRSDELTCVTGTTALRKRWCTARHLSAWDACGELSRCRNVAVLLSRPILGHTPHTSFCEHCIEMETVLWWWANPVTRFTRKRKKNRFPEREERSPNLNKSHRSFEVFAVFGQTANIGGFLHTSNCASLYNASCGYAIFLSSTLAVRLEHQDVETVTVILDWESSVIRRYHNNSKGKLGNAACGTPTSVFESIRLVFESDVYYRFIELLLLMNRFVQQYASPFLQCIYATTNVSNEWTLESHAGSIKYPAFKQEAHKIFA